MAKNMQPHVMADTWSAGSAYEPYVGRWSLMVARQFLPWLKVGTRAEWLDVGCGTGALCQAIVETISPVGVKGVDPSEEIIAYARKRIDDNRVRFAVAGAQALTSPRTSRTSMTIGHPFSAARGPLRPIQCRYPRKGDWRCASGYVADCPLPSTAPFL